MTRTLTLRTEATATTSRLTHELGLTDETAALLCDGQPSELTRGVGWRRGGHHARLTIVGDERARRTKLRHTASL